MPRPPRKPPDRRATSALRWRLLLLLLWAAASFGVTFFARELTQVVAGWPLNYWWMGQGGVLVFIAIVAAYAWSADRRAPPPPQGPADE